MAPEPPAAASISLMPACRWICLIRRADNAWKQGIYMRHPDRKILMKSDYLRKEAELYINYISKGEEVEKNNFMCKSLKEINEGSSQPE